MNEGRPEDPSPEPSAPPRIPRWVSLAGGAGGAMVSVMLYAFGTGMVDAFWTAALIAILPALSLAQLPVMRRVVLPRMDLYRGSIATLLFIGVVSTAVGGSTIGLRSMGLDRPESWSTTILWTGGLFVAGVMVMGAFSFVIDRWAGGESALVRRLMPRSPEEKRGFAALSVAAGTCEEIAYRGYVMPIAMTAFGSEGAAVAFATIPFAVMHAYQGWIGVLRSGAIGILFAVAFLRIESLVPLMAAHVAIDLFGGLVLGGDE